MKNWDLISFTLQHSIKLLAIRVQVFHLLVKELLYFLFCMCWTCAITFNSTSPHCCWPVSLTATRKNNYIMTVSNATEKLQYVHFRKKYTYYFKTLLNSTASVVGEWIVWAHFKLKLREKCKFLWGKPVPIIICIPHNHIWLKTDLPNERLVTNCTR